MPDSRAPSVGRPRRAVDEGRTSPTTSRRALRRAPGRRPRAVHRPGPDHRRGRGVPHRRAPCRRDGPRPRDDPLHRSRRVDGQATALGDAAWVALLERHNDAVRQQLGGSQGRDRHGGRRVPRPLRRAGAGRSLRPGRPGRFSRASARASAQDVQRARSSVGAETAARIAVHVGARVMSLAGSGEELGQRDDASTSSQAPASGSRPRRARLKGVDGARGLRRRAS